MGKSVISGNGDIAVVLLAATEAIQNNTCFAIGRATFRKD
jgi:hypothetical protein